MAGSGADQVSKEYRRQSTDAIVRQRGTASDIILKRSFADIF